MSKTLESLFVSEFRREIANVGYKDIYKIPLPDECKDWEVSGTEVYAVKGIEVPYYDVLNKSLVKRVPRGFEAKRRIIDKAVRGFAKNPDGTYQYEDFPKTANSVVVISDRQNKLPYSEYKKKVSKEGYGYIDFVEKGKKIEYLYVLPKSVLYRVNQTALALSVKNMKNYSGSGYVTWRNGVIFLHVIPYNPNARYEGTKILKTGYSLDYNKEIKSLISYWLEVNLIPNLSLCTLQDGSNIALKPTMVGYESYMPVETLALSDREVYGSVDSELE